MMVFLVMSGCSGNVADEALVSEGGDEVYQEEDKGLLDDAEFIALEYEGKLWLVDIKSGNKEEVYEFGDGELPPVIGLETFVVSPSNKFVVWYSATEGIIKFDLFKNEARALYKPSEWFNSYPYLVMDEAEDALYIIDNEGKELKSINIEEESVETVDIPHPFGTRFLFSDIKEKILFISGFRIDEGLSQYMITNFDGSEPTRFSSNTEASQRDEVVWNKDGSGILVIVDNKIFEHLIDNMEEPKLFLEVKGDSKILEIDRVEDELYVLSDDRIWRIYDIEGAKEVRRIPEEIVVDLNKPKFYPIDKGQWLIEESLSRGEDKFSRLWVSDDRGNKKMVIPEYHLRTVQTDVIEL